jgi:hypothetical protein
MRHSIVAMDCTDSILIDRIVLRILQKIYASPTSLAENLRNLGLLVVQPEDDTEVHFVFCNGAERSQRLFDKIKIGLLDIPNWKFMLTQKQPLAEGEFYVTWTKQADGIKIAHQLELVYIRLEQLLTIALGSGSDFTFPMFAERGMSTDSTRFKLFILF